MGHKWMWNESLGGLPPKSSSSASIRCSPACATNSRATTRPPTTSPGTSPRNGPKSSACKPGIPIPVGAFDAHWDAIGAGCRDGDVVNVVGTSTCIIGDTRSSRSSSPASAALSTAASIRGYTGIEAGLSAVGDIFNAIASAPEPRLPNSRNGLENYRAGQTGLLRLTWDNGDRTVLVNPELGGITLGWNLHTHRAGRTVRRHRRHRVPHPHHPRPDGGARRADQRVINGGGIPQKNEVLNQVYANVLGRPCSSPAGASCRSGSAIFAFLAAGVFKSIEEAQEKICPTHKTYEPQPHAQQIYECIYPLYRNLYFGFGDPRNGALGSVLPRSSRPPNRAANLKAVAIFASRALMKRHILIYGLVGGVLIGLLKWSEYRFLVVEHSLEIYGGLVAATFAAIGIWLGLKLTRPRETVVVKEVPVPSNGPFQLNSARQDSSPSRLASWRSSSSSPKDSATARSPPACSSAKTPSRRTPAASSTNLAPAVAPKPCNSPKLTDYFRDNVAQKNENAGA